MWEVLVKYDLKDFEDMFAVLNFKKCRLIKPPHILLYKIELTAIIDNNYWLTVNIYDAVHIHSDRYLHDLCNEDSEGGL